MTSCTRVDVGELCELGNLWLRGSNAISFDVLFNLYFLPVAEFRRRSPALSFNLKHCDFPTCKKLNVQSSDAVQRRNGVDSKNCTFSAVDQIRTENTCPATFSPTELVAANQGTLGARRFYSTSYESCVKQFVRRHAFARLS